MADEAWPMNDGLARPEEDFESCADIPLPPVNAWINYGLGFVALMFLGTLVNLFAVAHDHHWGYQTMFMAVPLSGLATLAYVLHAEKKRIASLKLKYDLGKT